MNLKQALKITLLIIILVEEIKSVRNLNDFANLSYDSLTESISSSESEKLLANSSASRYW